MQRFDRKMKQHWCGVTELSENTGADNKKHSSSFVEQMEKRKKNAADQKKMKYKANPCWYTKEGGKARRGHCQSKSQHFHVKVTALLVRKGEQALQNLTFINHCFESCPEDDGHLLCFFFFFHILFCCKCHKIHKQNGNLIFQQRIKHNPTARSLQCTAAKGTLSDFGNSLQLPFGFPLLVSMGKGVR